MNARILLVLTPMALLGTAAGAAPKADPAKAEPPKGKVSPRVEAALKEIAAAMQDNLHEAGLAAIRGKPDDARKPAQKAAERLYEMRENAPFAKLRALTAQLSLGQVLSDNVPAHLEKMGDELVALSADYDVAEAVRQLAQAGLAHEMKKGPQAVRDAANNAMFALIGGIVKIPLHEWRDSLQRINAILGGSQPTARKCSEVQALVAAMEGEERFYKRAARDFLTLADLEIGKMSEEAAHGRLREVQAMMKYILDNTLTWAGKSARTDAVKVKINGTSTRFATAWRFLNAPPKIIRTLDVNGNIAVIYDNSENIAKAGAALQEARKDIAALVASLQD